MSEKEESLSQNEDGELEEEVRRIIRESYEKDKTKERVKLENIYKLKQHKKDFAIYFSMGCVSAYFASEFAIASWLPIKFSNLENAGVLVGATIVNAVLANYFFKKAKYDLEYLMKNN